MSLIKQRLLSAIEQTPEPLLGQTLAFLEFLTARTQSTIASDLTQDFDPDTDFSPQILADLKASLHQAKAGQTFAIAELLQQTRFLTNNLGEQTDVVIPIDAWNTVIALVESLQSIDDAHWAQQAEQARNSSAMVGTDLFIQEIKRLASLDG
jgi:hypothetical protein